MRAGADYRPDLADQCAGRDVRAVYPMAYETFEEVIENLPRFIDDVYNSRHIPTVDWV
jgi:hypothetical protein